MGRIQGFQSEARFRKGLCSSFCRETYGESGCSGILRMFSKKREQGFQEKLVKQEELVANLGGGDEEILK